MSENKLSVRIEVRNQKIRAEFEQIISSTSGFLIKDSDKVKYCDLLILEVGENILNEFDHVRSLKDAGTVKEIFLTSSRTDTDTLIKALRSGAKEFFKQPLNREEVTASLMALKEQAKNVHIIPIKKKKSKIITVMGSKGGVGTTTVAVNLAACLNELRNEQSIVLIDMNLIFGEVPIFLELRTSFNWGEVAKNISRVDSTYLMSVLTKHSSGIYVLPSPTDLNGVNYATPEIMEQLLELMKKEFDYIVIDNGQSLNTISLKVIEMSDVVCLVSVMSLPCLANVKKLFNTFRKLGRTHEEKIKVVMNRYNKKSVLSIADAEKGLEKKISWLIPNDYNTAMASINQGKLISQVAKKSDIAMNFADLAANIEGKNEVINPKKTFWKWNVASF